MGRRPALTVERRNTEIDHWMLWWYDPIENIRCSQALQLWSSETLIAITLGRWYGVAR